MRRPEHPIRRLPWAVCCLFLVGCLATPQAEPPVVSTSERRANYQGALVSVWTLAPPPEAQRSPAAALYTELDSAVQRRLRAAGVPTAAAQLRPGETMPVWRRDGASHLVRISLPSAPAGRTTMQVELRDTLTRSVVWRYAGELDTAAPASPQRVADRMADALVHRLREDGLLAR